MVLTYTTTNHIATITLDRPEVMNALNRDLYAALEQAFIDAHRDPNVRAVILTGAGKAFCSGDDVRQIMLAERPPDTAPRARDARPRPTPAAIAVLNCDKPVIAAVNGPAVGWGMDLTLFCDIRIASDRARFGELFVKRGLVSDVGGLWRLPQVVGPSKAAELLFTGDIIDAHEAERIGLVSRVVPHDDLISTATALAEKIANNPPLAVRHLKEGLRRSVYGDVNALGEYVGNSLAYLFTTEDHKEGAQSFIEKREPVFKGR
jgi:enoyl-CoA hydratase/carnithine racemase